MIYHQGTKTPSRPKRKKPFLNLFQKALTPSLVSWCLGGEKGVRL
jgi:hypothetical protein